MKRSIASLFLLAGCGGSEPALAGKWTDLSRDAHTIEFRSDGAFRETAAGGTHAGTWARDGKEHLVLTYAGDSEGLGTVRLFIARLTADRLVTESSRGQTGWRRGP